MKKATTARLELYNLNQTVRFFNVGIAYHLYVYFFMLQLYKYVYSNTPAILVYNGHTKRTASTPYYYNNTSVPVITYDEAALLQGPILMDRRKIVVKVFGYHSLPNVNLYHIVREMYRR